MVTARFTWDIDTLRKGVAVHIKTQRAAKLIPLMAVVFLAWGAYSSYTTGHWVAGLPLIVLGLLLLFGYRPLVTWQFSRAVRRSPSYGSQMTYTFDPQQIVNSGEGHHAAFTWKKLYSATVTGDGILLYTNKNLFHWIPVAAFESPSDIATVQNYLQENGVRTQNV